jgi:peptidoglycan/LPS O-acetylase OafA/YrhL
MDKRSEGLTMTPIVMVVAVAVAATFVMYYIESPIVRLLSHLQIGFPDDDMDSIQIGICRKVWRMCASRGRWGRTNMSDLLPTTSKEASLA